jgi:hypothetical protein
MIMTFGDSDPEIRSKFRNTMEESYGNSKKGSPYPKNSEVIKGKPS